MGSKALWGVVGLPLLILLTGATALHVGGLTQEVSSLSPPTQPSPPPRRATRAGSGDPGVQGLVGVIVAEESVDLSATLEGRVASVRVRLGDRVRRGDVIATLDATALRRELAIAEAELLSARAEEETAALARTEAGERLGRREEPRQLQTGALSEEELATARYQERMAAAKLNGARAHVLQMEARVQQFRQRLSEATLLAPFDAWVGHRYVHPGALISPGRAIVHLLRAGSRKVRFAIPEKQAHGIRVGQPVHVTVPGQEVRLEGRIESLAPEVDVASRMLFGIASLEEPAEAPIPAGTVVRLSLTGDVATGWNESVGAKRGHAVP